MLFLPVRRPFSSQRRQWSSTLGMVGLSDRLPAARTMHAKKLKLASWYPAKQGCAAAPNWSKGRSAIALLPSESIKSMLAVGYEIISPPRAMGRR